MSCTFFIVNECNVILKEEKKKSTQKIIKFLTSNTQSLNGLEN